MMAPFAVLRESAGTRRKVWAAQQLRQLSGVQETCSARRHDVCP
jgi:hypothetical protein